MATAAGKPVFSLHSAADAADAAAGEGGNGAEKAPGAEARDSDAGSAGLAAAGVALSDYADGLVLDDDEGCSSSVSTTSSSYSSAFSAAATRHHLRNSLVSLTTPSGLRVLLARRGGLRLSVASRAGEPDAALLCYAEAAHASVLSLLTDRVHSALAAQPSFDAGRLLGGAGGVLSAVARGWGGGGFGGGSGGAQAAADGESLSSASSSFDACDLCAAFPPLPLPSRLRAEATAALTGALAATGGVAERAALLAGDLVVALAVARRPRPPFGSGSSSPPSKSAAAAAAASAAGEGIHDDNEDDDDGSGSDGGSEAQTPSPPPAPLSSGAAAAAAAAASKSTSSSTSNTRASRRQPPPPPWTPGDVNVLRAFVSGGALGEALSRSSSSATATTAAGAGTSGGGPSSSSDTTPEGVAAFAPICLPGISRSGFMHAHISVLEPRGSGIGGSSSSSANRGTNNGNGDAATPGATAATAAGNRIPSDHPPITLLLVTRDPAAFRPLASAARGAASRLAASGVVAEAARRSSFSMSGGGRPRLRDLPASAGGGLPRCDALVSHFVLRSMARKQVLCSSIEGAAEGGETAAIPPSPGAYARARCALLGGGVPLSAWSEEDGSGGDGSVGSGSGSGGGGGAGGDGGGLFSGAAERLLQLSPSKGAASGARPRPAAP